MNSTFRFETPKTNFQRLLGQDLSEKFQIIINSGSKEVFEVTKNEARIISKKINELCMIDPTVTKYELIVPRKDEKQTNEGYQDIFNLIIESTRGEIEIPNDKQKKFSMIQSLLGEESPFSENDIKIQNIEEAFSLLNTDFENIAIKYMSNHFLELIESGQMRNLSQDVIFTIIDNYSEKDSQQAKEDTGEIEEKEEEIQKIFSIIQNQEDESIVIHFILMNKIEYKSDLLNEMIQYVNSHLDDDVVLKELPRITAFLQTVFEFKEKIGKNKKGKIIKCTFNGDNYSGIVSYLKKNFGQEAFKLTGGGHPASSNPITNIIKYNGDEFNKFYYNWSEGELNGELDSWIEFDFYNRKINLTSYTIRTNQDGPNSLWSPKTWRIVGSNDHVNWTVLNRQEDRPELNGIYQNHRFECDPCDDYYQYIRYIQEDSWDSSYCRYSFSLTCFEIFGSILEPI